jgi:hypothetical protein
MYQLADKKFRTKEQIKKFFKNYKDTNPVDSIVTEPYHTYLFELLKWHPEFHTWNYNNSAKECFQFKVIQDWKYGKYTAYSVRRIDVPGQAEWPFSYLKCITSNSIERNNKTNVMMAARESIQEQIYEYRDSQEGSNGMYRCVIDWKLYRKNDIHVDHHFKKTPFKKLLDEFLKSRGLDYNLDMIKDKYDYHCFPTHIDSAWKSYHREHAILRCIHKRHNLRGRRMEPTMLATADPPQMSNGLPHDEIRYQREKRQYKRIKEKHSTIEAS